MSIETYEATTRKNKITVNYLDDEHGRQLVTEMKVNHADYAVPTAIGEAVASHLSEREEGTTPPPVRVVVNGAAMIVTFALDEIES